MNTHEENATMEEPKHSFGGRGFMSRFVDYDPDDGLGGSEVAPEPVEQAAVVEPVVEPVVEEPVVQPLTREDIISAAREAAAAGAGESFQALMARAQAEEDARRANVAPELPEWDPYDRAAVAAHMAAMFTPLFRQLEERIAPAAAGVQQYQMAQGEIEARTLLDGMKTGDDGVGEFDNDRAIERARMLLSNGSTTDPVEALRTAAQTERAYVEAIEVRTAEKLGLVANAHLAVVPEPAGSGGGASAEVATLPRGSQAYRVQLERSLAARGARPGVAVPTG